MFSDSNDRTLVTFFISATLLTVIFVFFLIVSLVRLRSRQRKKEEQLLHALINERERTMT
jgi:two-component system NarL family sensor kinase